MSIRETGFCPGRAGTCIAANTVPRPAASSWLPSDSPGDQAEEAVG